MKKKINVYGKKALLVTINGTRWSEMVETAKGYEKVFGFVKLCPMVYRRNFWFSR